MAEHRITLQLQNENEKNHGVLLYYKYASVPDLKGLFDFYNANCTALSLIGRVRISSHGVNVTVGGRLRALEEHIETVKSNVLFEGTDFKLAPCLEPLNDQLAKECGFTSLSIRIVKELVTLGSHPLLKSPEISNAGRHLSAAEFHSVLQNAGKCQSETSTRDKKMILLDARNLYETRIGKFETPYVETLDPEIRQYSELPSWIDNNSEKLRGNNILMYCTGGIRCEMASAYIRSKGAGFENVFQLYGGIQRYMEQFPDGGFFKGKNFVFDHRVSMESLDSKILGTCLLCDAPFDDYTPRCRCIHCRMLVLICDGCRKNSCYYVCELCKNNGKHVALISSEEYMSKEVSHDDSLSTDRAIQAHLSLCIRDGYNPTIRKSTTKLRILCLHGFRQNSSTFKGRTSSFAKKLKNIADFVFSDGPHELPFIYQRPNHRPTNPCNKKFAWLVSADYDCRNDDLEWKMAETPFESLQYRQQTAGFEKSIDSLKSVFLQDGPFDGILGFSQGAAMAALVGACKESLKGVVDFRFLILCSGFAVDMEEFAPEGTINCPSLHIFGNKDGGDRQIDCEASRRLASFFEKGCSVVVEHDLGHIIPTRSPYIDEVNNFLRRFM